MKSLHGILLHPLMIPPPYGCGGWDCSYPMEHQISALSSRWPMSVPAPIMTSSVTPWGATRARLASASTLSVRKQRTGHTKRCWHYPCPMTPCAAVCLAPSGGCQAVRTSSPFSCVPLPRIYQISCKKTNHLPLWRKLNEHENRIQGLSLLLCPVFDRAFLLVPVYAVEDMWPAARRTIKDIYTHIASVGTVLAGLMIAIAVIGAKMSNTPQKSHQAWDWLTWAGCRCGVIWILVAMSLMEAPFNYRLQQYPEGVFDMTTAVHGVYAERT